MELTAKTLAHPKVRLEPFEERHRKGLTEAAEADLSIFEHMPFPIDKQGYSFWFDLMLQEKAAGKWIPYAVIAPNGKIVGQSCFMHIRPADAGVEIGATWYARAAQGTAINPAAKFLLLDHAFACGAERVDFKTDERNARSRAALLKLGARFEGIFLRHMRRRDGTLRDSAYYSIIREEWPSVRQRIETRIAALN